MIRLYCLAAISRSPPHGNRFDSMTAATSVNMMPVASSGSKKPLDNPIATQFFFQLTLAITRLERNLARRQARGRLADVVSKGLFWRRHHLSERTNRHCRFRAGYRARYPRSSLIRARLRWCTRLSVNRTDRAALASPARCRRTTPSGRIVRHTQRGANQLRTKPGAIDK